MTQAISALVGVLLSLSLHLIPRVRAWWQTQRGKVLILLTFHIGGALLTWVAACPLDFSLSFPVDCSYQGLAAAGWTGTVGFIANQSTYGLTNYGIPYARRKIQRVSERIAAWKS